MSMQPAAATFTQQFGNGTKRSSTQVIHKARYDHKKRRRGSTIGNTGRFHYKPLDRSVGAIRLIKVFPLGRNDNVSCRIERHHVSTSSYVALSYVWGSQDATSTIYLNNLPYKVRPNLHAFLQHLAKAGYFADTLFWIDAICINQDDVTEKNHHISHMGLIYSHATKVIAWLGNSSYYATSGSEPPGPWMCCRNMRQDQTLGRRHHCEWRVPNATSWSLLRHEYWCRLWVAQELELARQVDVLWRARFYSWSMIKTCLGRNLDDIHNTHEDNITIPNSFIETTNYISKLPVSRYLKPTDSAPLGTLVPRFALHECRIGHDHVFALLSMAPDGNKFEPDYAESCISLMLRLLTFCYESPTTSFTRKVGSALGLDPEGKGIPCELLGHPETLETCQTQSTYFRLADSYKGTITNTDLLVRLPDTNLCILFRQTSSSDRESSYNALSRVNTISARVEQGRQRFARNSIKHKSSRHDERPFSESPVWSTARLKLDSNHKTIHLHCSWEAVLSIFESSQTKFTHGRLESRIREWKVPSGIEADNFQSFVVTRGPSI